MPDIKTNFGGLSDVIISFSADTSGLDAGAREIEKVLDRTNRAAEKSIKELADTAQKAGRSFLYVLDGATRAYVKQELVQRDVNKKLAAGLITRTLANKKLDEEAAYVAKTTARYRDLTAAQGSSYALQATRGLNSTRAMGTAIQQAGYQVGDFAVQVASGQSAVRAFIQQGTQLVSMFGPYGALAGAALAIGGAIYTAFDRGASATEEAKKRTESYTEALASLEDQQKAIVRLQKQFYGTLEADPVESAKRAVRNRLIEQAQARRELNDLMTQKPTGTFEGSGIILKGKQLLAERRYNKAVAETAKAGDDLKKAREANLEIQKLTIQNDQTELEQKERLVSALANGVISLEEFNIQQEVHNALKERQIKAGTDEARQVETQIRLEHDLASAIDEKKAAIKEQEKAREQRDATIKRIKTLKEEVELTERLTDKLLARTISQRDYDAELRVANALRGKDADLTEAQIEQYEKLTRRLDEAKDRAKQFADAQDKIAKEAQAAAEKVAKAWQSQVDKAAGVFRNFLETGKVNWREFIQDLLITAATARFQNAVLDPLKGFLGGFPAITGFLANGVPGSSKINWNGPKFAGGGPVSGPGGPRDDRILAMLSNGEYVVNANAARRNRALLDAINNGRVNNRYANGGMVARSPSSTQVMNNNRGGDTFVINNTVNASTGVSQTVRAEFQKLMPLMERRAVRAIKDARARGQA